MLPTAAIPNNSLLHSLIWSPFNQVGTCCCIRLHAATVSSVVAQMSQQGVERSVGDAVDAWNDGGWWVGRVTSAPAATDGAGAGAAAASPRRCSGRRKGSSPPAAQPPLRVLLAGSGEELQVQQVTHIVGDPVSSCCCSDQAFCASTAVLLMQGVSQHITAPLPCISIISVPQADLRTALEWNGADWLPAPPSALPPPAPAAAAGRSSAAPDAAGKQQLTSTKKGSKQAAPPQTYQVLLPASCNVRLSGPNIAAQ